MQEGIDWCHDHPNALAEGGYRLSKEAVILYTMRNTAALGAQGVHLLCLRDMGLMPGEYRGLTALADDYAADGVYEFQLVAPPLSVVGAVGSPVNPVAVK